MNPLPLNNLTHDISSFNTATDLEVDENYFNSTVKLQVDLDSIHEPTGDDEVEVALPSTSLESPQLSACQIYSKEWDDLFMRDEYITSLRLAGIKGAQRSCRFRSVCWRVYLECLPEDPKQWLEKTRESRKNYEELQTKLLTNPRVQPSDIDLTKNNPLSQEENSAWNQFFQDGELRVTIRQDVIRTFPEIEFFQEEGIRSMMIKVLFYYARIYPHLSYRQGMHELLAPLIFVLHSDHQAFLHASENGPVDDLIRELLNPEYIEHDSFTMFCQLMETVEPWYLVREGYHSKVDLAQQVPFSKLEFNSSNVILTKLTRIQETLLKNSDLDLYNHLEKLEIVPQIYGIRWLRLIFGREYPLQDLLVVWDAIFADNPHFVLVDYIFIAMLVYIRNLLLSGDYAQCLSYLMRYPAVTDVHCIIDLAFHIRDPTKYPPPATYSISTIPPLRSDLHRVPSREEVKEQKTKAAKPTPVKSSGFSTLTKKMRPRTLGVGNKDTTPKKPTNGPKANSEPSSFGSASPSPTLGDYVRMNTGSVEDGIIPPEPTESEMKPILNDTGTRPKIRASRNSWQDGISSGVRDEQLASSSPQKKLTNRPLAASFRNKTPNKAKPETTDHASFLLSKLNDVQGMCSYCSQQLSLHIDRLQETILRQKLEDEDDMLIALAGIKQVRDILKGSLKFTSSFVVGEHESPTKNNSSNNHLDSANPQSPAVDVLTTDLKSSGSLEL